MLESALSSFLEGVVAPKILTDAAFLSISKPALKDVSLDNGMNGSISKKQMEMLS
jgi:hypothetical protein